MLHITDRPQPSKTGLGKVLTRNQATDPNKLSLITAAEQRIPQDITIISRGFAGEDEKKYVDQYAKLKEISNQPEDELLVRDVMDDIVEAATIKTDRTKLINKEQEKNPERDREDIERKTPEARNLAQEAEEKIEKVLASFEKLPQDFLTEEMVLIIKERINGRKLNEQIKQTYTLLEQVHGIPSKFLQNDEVVRKLTELLQAAQSNLGKCQDIISPQSEDSLDTSS